MFAAFVGDYNPDSRHDVICDLLCAAALERITFTLIIMFSLDRLLSKKIHPSLDQPSFGCWLNFLKFEPSPLANTFVVPGRLGRVCGNRVASRRLEFSWASRGLLLAVGFRGIIL